MNPSVLYDPIRPDAIVLLREIPIFIMVIRQGDTIQATQKKSIKKN
ncbi:MAG: hypothetical protein H7839_06420 [Magnetococcus sp. YQC-5]